MPRCIPEGLCAVIAKDTIKTPPIFKLIQAEGGIDEHDMYNTFNMGVGMCMVVAVKSVEKCLAILKAAGEEAYVAGTVVSAGADGAKIVLK